jgi:hypothetical protein
VLAAIYFFAIYHHAGGAFVKNFILFWYGLPIFIFLMTYELVLFCLVNKEL